jgi:uncharacterized membrane-anchored protein YitT (DUF2179 family)
MYFWNIEKLKEDIRADRVTEKDRFIYALIYLAFSVISFEFLTHVPFELKSEGARDIAVSAINVLIILAGTIFAFKANGSIDGIDFLGKYFSIGFVLEVRFTVFILPLLAVYLSTDTYVFLEAEAQPRSWDSILLLAWSSALYWRMYVYIRQISVSKTSILEAKSCV